MKIAFSRLNKGPYPFKLNLKTVVFEGNALKISAKLVRIDAKMRGFAHRPCDRCGEELELSIDESLELFASDGLFKDTRKELSNTVEFFDSQIDLMELAVSEFEAYLSDYFYCEDCMKRRENGST